MGKKTSKAKAPEGHEEAVAAVNAAKEARETAKNNLTEFLEKNKLRKNADHSGKIKDKKLQKEYDGLRDAWEKAKTAEGEAKEAEKGLRPKKDRKVKYNYPADMTSSGDRKKFRAACRTRAKAAGVSVDEYLSDPEKYDKEVEGKKAAKKSTKKEKKEPAKKDAKASTKKAAKKGSSKKAKATD